MKHILNFKFGFFLLVGVIIGILISMPDSVKIDEYEWTGTISESYERNDILN